MQQDALRLKYIALGWRHAPFCHVCGSRDSRWSSRARNQAEILLRLQTRISQRKCSSHFVPLQPVTSSHYHRCITNHSSRAPASSSCSCFPLCPRGAVGTLVGRREASCGGDCFPGQSTTKATSAHELLWVGTRAWERLGNHFPCIYSIAGTFPPSFLQMLRDGT